MTQAKDRRGKPRPASAPAAARGPARKPEAAFDLWLARGLHQLFDDIANEPIPEELLKLIKNDRQP